MKKILAVLFLAALTLNAAPAKKHGKKPQQHHHRGLIRLAGHGAAKTAKAAGKVIY